MEDEYGFGDPPERQDPIESLIQDIQAELINTNNELGFIKGFLVLLIVLGIIALYHFW